MATKKLKNTKNSKEIACEYHPEGYILEDSGTMVCSECGFVVVEQTISTEAEWRTFGDDSCGEIWQKSRVGQAENVFLSNDANLETSISMADMNRNNVSMYRSKAFKRRSVDKANLNASNVLDEMGSRIHLPQSVVFRAKFVFNRWYRNNLKGNINIIDANFGACLYIACHLEKCPRTILEICGITEASALQINRAQKRICKYLKIQLDPINSADMIPRICGNLELPKNVQKKASVIALELHEQKKNYIPDVIAAGSVYLAVKSAVNPVKSSLQDIAAAVGVSSGRISRCIR